MVNSSNRQIEWTWNHPDHQVCSRLQLDELTLTIWCFDDLLVRVVSSSEDLSIWLYNDLMIWNVSLLHFLRPVPKRLHQIILSWNHQIYRLNGKSSIISNEREFPLTIKSSKHKIVKSTKLKIFKVPRCTKKVPYGTYTPYWTLMLFLQMMHWFVRCRSSNNTTAAESSESVYSFYQRQYSNSSDWLAVQFKESHSYIWSHLIMGYIGILIVLYATSFNGDVFQWNTGKVTSMPYMFANAYEF